ncbi:MAG: NUDIX domain-containing protein [Candidatus Limnocylindrales bacterium]
MSERTSSGILLFRRRAGALEVLLAHPGGPFHARRDLGNWSIPKGEPSEGEVPEAAARREFEEETGAPAPSAPLIPLGSTRQKGGKVVSAWAAEGDLATAAAHSNTFDLEWPPGSGQTQAFPEVDRVEWFALDDARVRLKAAQVVFIDRLETALRGS